MLVLLAQISDPHIGATWSDADPERGLAATVDAVAALTPAVDGILLSGDLADGGSQPQYQRLRELLAPLTAPLYPLAGNHDDRARLRAAFGLPGSGDEPIQYTANVGGLRLVVLDSQRPGHDGGELGSERLRWLEGELASAPRTPTLVALHHPPILIAVPAFDRIGLPTRDVGALAELVAAHAQVRALVCGHVHRPIAGQLAGRPVLCAPSTFIAAALSIGAQELTFLHRPPGYALHVLTDGELISHVEYVAVGEGWVRR
jgi:3',5'-cyclic AMP phosphodiesterase CpdA